MNLKSIAEIPYKAINKCNVICHVKLIYKVGKHLDTYNVVDLK